MLWSARRKSSTITEMQEIKKKKKKIGLNMNLTRSVVNGVSEEKAKEIELSSLRRSIGKDVKTSFTL